MNIFFIFFFAFLFKNIFNQIVSLNGTKNISPEIKQFLMKNKINKIGNIVNQKYKSNSIKVYNNTFFSFKIMTSNNDYGIGPNFFLRSYINNNNIPLNKIELKYESENYVFNSKSLSDYEINNNNNNFNLNCTYLIKNPTFNYIFFSINNNYSKIQNAFNNFFGLFNNNIYLINDYNSNDKILLENNTKNNINNFFILKDNKVHMFFLIVFFDNYIFSLFKINFDENKSFLNLTNILEQNNTNDKIAFPINSVQIYNNILFISSYNKGIYVLDVLKNNTNIINEKNNILSLIINDKSFYALQENKGILIYNKTNFEITNLLEISNAFYLDFIINPFNGLKSIGVYINNKNKKNNYDEFFIELILFDEFKPNINKILTSSNIYVKSIINFDNIFTYILDSNNKKIIIIRRGLPNSINFITYVLPINIDSNISENSNIFLTPYYDIYNKYDKKIYISFIYDNKIFVYNKLNFHHDELKCNIKDSGFYSFYFSQEVDTCTNSLNYISGLTLSNLNNTNFRYCNKYTIYNIRVIDGLDQYFLFLIIFFSFISIVFILIVIFLIYIDAIKRRKLKMRIRNVPYQITEEKSFIYKDNLTDIEKKKYNTFYITQEKNLATEYAKRSKEYKENILKTIELKKRLHSEPNYNIKNKSNQIIKNYINYQKDNNSERNKSKLSHRIGSSELSFGSSNMMIFKFKEKN